MSKNSYPSSHNQHRQTGRARRAIAGAALAATVATGGGVYAGVKAHNRSVASRPENVAKKEAQEKAKQAAEANANTRVAAIINKAAPVLDGKPRQVIENKRVDLIYGAQLIQFEDDNKKPTKWLHLSRDHGRDPQNDGSYSEDLSIYIDPATGEVTQVSATSYALRYKTDEATGLPLKDSSGGRILKDGGGLSVTMTHEQDGSWSMRGVSNEVEGSLVDLNTGNPKDIANFNAVLTEVSDLGANLLDPSTEFGQLE